VYTRRRKTKQKHNTIPVCVGNYYAQTNTNNVNKTCTLLQTTGDKNDQKIVFMRKSQHETHNTITHNRTTQKTKEMSNTDPNKNSGVNSGDREG